MYDLELMSKIVGDIEMYLNDLGEMKIDSIEKLQDRKTFYAISMVMFSIINRTINLGEEIIVANKFGVPSTYKDVFYILARNGVISRKLRDGLCELVPYRNMLSHEYHAISDDELFELVNKIKIVPLFVSKVKNFVNATRK